MLSCALLQNEGQQRQDPRPLDGPGQFALFLGRDSGNTAGNDLAPFREVALQRAHVLVVDLGCIGAREWAGLAPALNGPGHGELGNSDILSHCLFLGAWFVVGIAIAGAGAAFGAAALLTATALAAAIAVPAAIAPAASAAPAA